MLVILRDDSAHAKCWHYDKEIIRRIKARPDSKRNRAHAEREESVAILK